MRKVGVVERKKKGHFFPPADGKRDKWEVSGPHFAGWEIYHMKGSPKAPDRIYVSQSSGWFGQVMQRSDDGGKTWQVPGGEKLPAPGEFPVGKSNQFVYDGSSQN